MPRLGNTGQAGQEFAATVTLSKYQTAAKHIGVWARSNHLLRLSQITPDATVTARLIHATTSACVRNSLTTGSSAPKTDFATTVRNTRPPVVIAVAAKWIPRITTKGPFNPVSSQSIYWPT